MSLLDQRVSALKYMQIKFLMKVHLTPKVYGHSMWLGVGPLLATVHSALPLA